MNPSNRSPKRRIHRLAVAGAAVALALTGIFTNTGAAAATGELDIPPDCLVTTAEQLADCLEAAPEGDTTLIQFGADIEFSDVIVLRDQHIELDLRGHTLAVHGGDLGMYGQVGIHISSLAEGGSASLTMVNSWGALNVVVEANERATGIYASGAVEVQATSVKVHSEEWDAYGIRAIGGFAVAPTVSVAVEGSLAVSAASAFGTAFGIYSAIDDDAAAVVTVGGDISATGSGGSEAVGVRAGTASGGRATIEIAGKITASTNDDAAATGVVAFREAGLSPELSGGPIEITIGGGIIADSGFIKIDPACDFPCEFVDLGPGDRVIPSLKPGYDQFGDPATVVVWVGDSELPDEFPFIDIPETSLFWADINWLWTSGITTGWEVDDGAREFRPGAFITREAMAAFIYRAVGSPVFDPPATPTFIDVPVGSPFYLEVEWLAAVGITDGWTVDGVREFRPDNSITREAMAAFLYRLAGSPAFDPPAAPSFRDVPASSSFYIPIEWLVSEGIAQGWDDGTFRPANEITREATAAFLHRASLVGGGLWDN